MLTVNRNARGIIAPINKSFLLFICSNLKYENIYNECTPLPFPLSYMNGILCSATSNTYTGTIEMWEKPPLSWKQTIVCSGITHAIDESHCSLYARYTSGKNISRLLTGNFNVESILPCYRLMQLLLRTVLILMVYRKNRTMDFFKIATYYNNHMTCTP